MQRSGILSDQTILGDCASLQFPVNPGKRHNFVPNPAGTVLASVRPGKEFLAPPQIVPLYVAENAAKSNGTSRDFELSLLEEDALKKLKGSTNYSVLGGAPQRASSLTQDARNRNLEQMAQIVPRLREQAVIERMGAPRPTPSIVRARINRAIALNYPATADTPPYGLVPPPYPPNPFPDPNLPPLPLGAHRPPGLPPGLPPGVRPPPGPPQSPLRTPSATTTPPTLSQRPGSAYSSPMSSLSPQLSQAEFADLFSQWSSAQTPSRGVSPQARGT